MNSWDVIVIGAGASGLVASIHAAYAGASCLLLEARERPGAKILASGNGRCNFSHQGFKLKNFHSKSPHFPKEVLGRFSEESTITWFRSLGLESIVDERQRYYPRSLQAGAVLDILRFSAEEAGVTMRTNSRVETLKYDGKNFHIRTFRGSEQSKTVVVACGGRAAPALGGTEDGYELLEGFGHHRTKLYPGIVQLKSELGSLKALKGQKWDCALSLEACGKELGREDGEVLFTNYGLSGPAVIQLSSLAQRAMARNERTKLWLNFFPTWDEERLYETLGNRIKAHPERSRVQIFIGLVPRMIASAALSQLHLKPQDAPASSLKDEDVQSLARLLTAWPQEITGSLDFKEAQVTIGGIEVDDFDPVSLASWLCPGLYACGEVLDVDGDCGGYNLQWAWSSGFVAGSEAAFYSRST